MQNPRQVAPPRQVPHPRAVRAPPRPPLRPLSALPAPYRPLSILLATSSPVHLAENLHVTSTSFSDTLTFHLWLENLTSLSFECVVFSFLFCLAASLFPTVHRHSIELFPLLAPSPPPRHPSEPCRQSTVTKGKIIQIELIILKLKPFLYNFCCNKNPVFTIRKHSLFMAY